MPFGAAFVVALIVLPAVLDGEAQDNVLLLILVLLGFRMVSDAADASAFSILMKVPIPAPPA